MEDSNNKAMGALSYIGILVLIPILAGGNSSYVRFHANQGLVLFIIEIALRIITIIFTKIPLIGLLVNILSGIIGVAILILVIMGIVDALQGKMSELPVIGQFKILK